MKSNYFPLFVNHRVSTILLYQLKSHKTQAEEWTSQEKQNASNGSVDRSDVSLFELPANYCLLVDWLKIGPAPKQFQWMQNKDYDDYVPMLHSCLPDHNR